MKKDFMKQEDIAILQKQINAILEQAEKDIAALLPKGIIPWSVTIPAYAMRIRGASMVWSVWMKANLEKRDPDELIREVKKQMEEWEQ